MTVGGMGFIPECLLMMMMILGSAGCLKKSQKSQNHRDIGVRPAEFLVFFGGLQVNLFNILKNKNGRLKRALCVTPLTYTHFRLSCIQAPEDLARDLDLNLDLDHGMAPTHQRRNRRHSPAATGCFRAVAAPLSHLRTRVVGEGQVQVQVLPGGKAEHKVSMRVAAGTMHVGARLWPGAGC